MWVTMFIQDGQFFLYMKPRDNFYNVETEPYYVSNFFELFDTAHQKQNWMRRDIEGESIDAPILPSDYTVPQ